MNKRKEQQKQSSIKNKINKTRADRVRMIEQTKEKMCIHNGSVGGFLDSLSFQKSFSVQKRLFIREGNKKTNA